MFFVLDSGQRNVNEFFMISLVKVNRNFRYSSSVNEVNFCILGKIANEIIKPNSRYFDLNYLSHEQVKSICVLCWTCILTKSETIMTKLRDKPISITKLMLTNRISIALRFRGFSFSRNLIWSADVDESISHWTSYSNRYILLLK